MAQNKNSTSMDERVDEKAIDSHVEDVSPAAATMPMRSKSDDLSVWQSMMKYKFVGVVAMSAAFSASLDGYRENFRAFQTAIHHADPSRDHTQRRHRFQQRLHPAIRNLGDDHYRWQVHFCMGRDSICRANDWPSCK